MAELMTPLPSTRLPRAADPISRFAPPRPGSRLWLRRPQRAPGSLAPTASSQGWPSARAACFAEDDQLLPPAMYASRNAAAATCKPSSTGRRPRGTSRRRQLRVKNCASIGVRCIPSRLTPGRAALPRTAPACQYNPDVSGQALQGRLEGTASCLLVLGGARFQATFFSSPAQLQALTIDLSGWNRARRPPSRVVPGRTSSVRTVAPAHHRAR